MNPAEALMKAIETLGIDEVKRRMGDNLHIEYVNFSNPAPSSKSPDCPKTGMKLDENE